MRRGGRYPGPRKISQLPVWDRNWSVPTQILRTHKDPPKLSSSFLFLYFGGVIIEIRCCSSPQRFGSSISYKKAPFGRAIERKGGIQLKFAAEKRLPKQVIGRFCADLDTVPLRRCNCHCSLLTFNLALFPKICKSNQSTMSSVPPLGS